MTTKNALGEYLRTRREQVSPVQVGLPPGGGKRRVPGLRREEVAMLAGISAEYYLRLEQGRDRHPSEQVLHSIARALRLEPDAEAYLLRIAKPKPLGRRRPSRSAKVAEGVQTLIDSWPVTPALVQSRYMHTLAANRLAVALTPFNAPGTNTLRAAFLEPAMRELYLDWDEMTAKAVAYLRAAIGPDADDPDLAALIGDLSLHSDRFRTLWAKQDVRHTARGRSRLMHPEVGLLDLGYEKLVLPASPGQVLVMYCAEPGSESAEKLQFLSVLAGASSDESR